MIIFVFYFKKIFSYNSNIELCPDGQDFNPCKNQSDCYSSYICSSSGYCANDLGATCTNDAQCVNNLVCNKVTATCGCSFTSVSSISAVNGE